MKKIFLSFAIVLNIACSIGQKTQLMPENFDFFAPFNTKLKDYFTNTWNINIPKYLPCFAYNSASAIGEDDPFYQLTNSAVDNRVFCTWKNGLNKPAKAYYWTEPIYKLNSKNQIIDSVYMTVVIQETDSFKIYRDDIIPIRKIMVRFTRNEPLVSPKPIQYQTVPKSVAKEMSDMLDYYEIVTGDKFYTTMDVLKSDIDLYRITEIENKIITDTIRFTNSLEKHIMKRYHLSTFPKLIKKGERADYGNDYSIYATEIKSSDNVDSLLFIGIRNITPVLVQYESNEYLVMEVLLKKENVSEATYVGTINILSRIYDFRRFINYGSQRDYLF